jgi:hypothetical protein
MARGLQKEKTNNMVLAGQFSGAGRLANWCIWVGFLSGCAEA